jgi:hypothetical protein
MSHPTLERRVQLVQQTEVPVTLDGEPACVGGYRNDFATVQRKDGKGGRVEFAWATVERVINNGGRFHS